MLRRIIVDVMWDDEARVYVATSREVPGLVAEASDWETLQAKLAVLIPELLELNGDGELSVGEEAEVSVFMEQRSRIRLRA